MTTKETKAGERTVKGWAVVGATGGLTGYSPYSVHASPHDAQDWRDEYAATHKNAENWKVVKCIITYSLT